MIEHIDILFICYACVMSQTAYLSATDLTRYLHRSRGHIYRRIATPYLLPVPVVPPPAPRWSQADLNRYFDSTPLPDVACIVPARDLADRELALGVYACPVDTGDHIGIERPSLLGLCDCGIVTVHSVARIETSSAVGPQSAHAASTLIDRIRADRKAGDEAWENLAVFHLSQKPVGTYPTTTVYQKGVVLHADQMRAAWKIGV